MICPLGLIRTIRWCTVSMMFTVPSFSNAMPRGSWKTLVAVSAGSGVPMVCAYVQSVAVRSHRSSRHPQRSAPHTSPSAATATRRSSAKVPGCATVPSPPNDVTRLSPFLLQTSILSSLPSAT